MSKQTQNLNDLTAQRKDDLRFKLKKFLKGRPYNYSAAAQELGVSRDFVVRLIEEEPAQFDELSDAWLDDLEEQMVHYLRGRPPAEDEVTFRFGDALRILERFRPRWSKTSVNKKKGEEEFNPADFAGLLQAMSNGPLRTQNEE